MIGYNDTIRHPSTIRRTVNEKMIGAIDVKAKKVYTAGAMAALLSLSACTQLPWQDNHEQVQHQKSSVGQRNEKDKGKSALPSSEKMVSGMNQDHIYVVADPASTQVLVNKHFKLPEDYVPKDLVYLHVPFIFSGKSEKKEMQAVAAKPLKEMFAAAKKDGIELAGVSAYRSHKTQIALFNYYAQRDGVKKALEYSARPGTSEHETGLAIDVSGITGKYAATQAFGKTPEAAWLGKHAQDFGFIVRYPKGKESVTGYEYEAWHLRYVGISAAKKITDSGETLEEYLHEVPVNK
ncbi:D-alanyl-D-alanine carboxypeptidase family protein [Sporolactobacillus kofuensis]|uniref:D-alanyl-D-alanine carboxypeptidase family protein n=1 Tax=Sporolactobacillus kofuensis TaxID=269672 RepID=A0ABW1WG75_9BACL|nr:M15 family metallopeptidase [Sporolactobacillus kofuensis]MCO7177064.1 M15 family metallopeptidase [Sporolactobacillus kofuensis]